MGAALAAPSSRSLRIRREGRLKRAVFTDSVARDLLRVGDRPGRGLGLLELAGDRRAERVRVAVAHGRVLAVLGRELSAARDGDGSELLDGRRNRVGVPG